MADRRMLPYHENRLFSKTRLFTKRKQDQSALFDLLSGTSFLSITREKMDNQYTCETILKALKGINFAEIQGQGFMPEWKSPQPA